jgi:hypothetical protein
VILVAAALLQEELQREVARQFAQLSSDSWHHVDASLSVEQVEAEVSIWRSFVAIVMAVQGIYY